MKTNLQTICHKNGSVSLWNGLEQRRCSYRGAVPPAVMATLPEGERRRIIAHLARAKSRQP